MIYADYNATSLTDTSHHEHVLRLLKTAEGNPSSIHKMGRQSKLILEDSRKHIGLLLGASPENIIFTSGATESNNLLITSILNKQQTKTTHFVLSKTEHPSIINPIEFAFKKNQCTRSFINVDKNGIVYLEEILNSITAGTSCICLIHVNNEVGSINPIQMLSQKIKEKFPNIHIHVDSVQALGKLDLTWLGTSTIDSASFSAHKIGGFKGCGCLYLKNPKNHQFSLLLGGSQEEGKRAGTENLPGIISFGLIAKELFKYTEKTLHIESLRTYLIDHIQRMPHVNINGTPSKTIFNTLNLYIKNRDIQELLLTFEHHNIAISSKSACSSGISAASYVLLAMGYSEEIAKNSIRISLGPQNTLDDVKKIVSVLKTF